MGSFVAVEEIILFNHVRKDSSAIIFPIRLTTVTFSPLTTQFMTNTALDIDGPWFALAVYEQVDFNELPT